MSPRHAVWAWLLAAHANLALRLTLSGGAAMVPVTRRARRGALVDCGFVGAMAELLVADILEE